MRARVLWHQTDAAYSSKADCATLVRPHLQDTILEADVLTQIRRWLEPIGKAMPALNIQRALLEALAKVSARHYFFPSGSRLTESPAHLEQFEIETSQLKASEIGKIVLFYTKHPKLDSSITRMADQLVSESEHAVFDMSACIY